MSKKMNQKLEDILSTCVDMYSDQGGPGEEVEPNEPEDTEKSIAYEVRNGKPEPGIPIVNVEKETSNGEPGTEHNRASDEVGDRDHRRPQENKKIKGLGKEIISLTQTLKTLSTPEEHRRPQENKIEGLGKEITSLTQTLKTLSTPEEHRRPQENKKIEGLGKEITSLTQTLKTLSTPEEKLAALCKKYAELLEENRNLQKQMKFLQKKQSQLVQEKDYLSGEHSKPALAQSKLESLCQELQQHNGSLKEEGMQRAHEEEEKRSEVTSHFQVTLSDIRFKMEQHNKQNSKLRQENAELAERLQKLIEQYELHEQLISKIFKHKALQQRLADTKLQQTQETLKESGERHQREKEFLQKEAEESRRMCDIMKQQGIHLQQQLTMYTERFAEFQSTLSKSNEVFIRFKQEMERMTNKIKKLEKENIMYRSWWESSNKGLLAEEKILWDKEMEGLQVKIQQLEKLCRALQTERNDLNKRVQDLTAGGQGSLTDIGSEQRPEDATTSNKPGVSWSSGAQPSSSPRATDAPGCPGAPSTETAGQTGPEEPTSVIA